MTEYQAFQEEQWRKLRHALMTIRVAKVLVLEGDQYCAYDREARIKNVVETPEGLVIYVE